MGLRAAETLQQVGRRHVPTAAARNSIGRAGHTTALTAILLTHVWREVKVTVIVDGLVRQGVEHVPAAGAVGHVTSGLRGRDRHVASGGQLSACEGSFHEAYKSGYHFKNGAPSRQSGATLRHGGLQHAGKGREMRDAANTCIRGMRIPHPPPKSASHWWPNPLHFPVPF